MERVVATDLEGTLTAGSTWRGVGRYLSEHGHRGRYRRFFWLRLPQVFLARRGIIDLQAFRERWMHDLTALLRGMSREQIEAMADWVFEQELWPGRREDVLDELQAARQDGARIVVASGTYTPIAARFAERLGAEAIGTDLAYDADDRATGGFAGAMGGFLMNLAAGVGNDGQARPFVLRVGRSRDQSLCLEAIDELCHV